MYQYQFSYELDSLSQLFTAPVMDLFSENEMVRSGESVLERIKHRLQPGPLPASIHLTLHLPAEQITPGLAEKLKVALDRFCTSSIEDTVNDLRLSRFNGARAALRGLIFLAICLLLAALFASDFLAFLPGFLRTILSEGFVVIGSLVLWHPVEAFLYSDAPIKHENELLQLIQRMNIELLPREEVHV